MQENDIANNKLKELDDLIIQIRHYAEANKDHKLWSMADKANALLRVITVSIN
jgi:hypothetical protein